MTDCSRLAEAHGIANVTVEGEMSGKKLHGNVKTRVPSTDWLQRGNAQGTNKWRDWHRIEETGASCQTSQTMDDKRRLYCVL